MPGIILHGARNTEVELGRNDRLALDVTTIEFTVLRAGVLPQSPGLDQQIADGHVLHELVVARTSQRALCRDAAVGLEVVPVIDDNLIPRTKLKVVGAALVFDRGTEVERNDRLMERRGLLALDNCVVEIRFTQQRTIVGKNVGNPPAFFVFVFSRTYDIARKVHRVHVAHHNREDPDDVPVLNGNIGQLIRRLRFKIENALVPVVGEPFNLYSVDPCCGSEPSGKRHQVLESGFRHNLVQRAAPYVPRNCRHTRHDRHRDHVARLQPDRRVVLTFVQKFIKVDRADTPAVPSKLNRAQRPVGGRTARGKERIGNVGKCSYGIEARRFHFSHNVYLDRPQLAHGNGGLDSLDITQAVEKVFLHGTQGQPRHRDRPESGNIDLAVTVHLQPILFVDSSPQHNNHLITRDDRV